MQMVGRTFSAGAYRYGFNGKENDNEVKGEGNTTAYEARIYDSRLGRWLSIDPLAHKFAGLSTYMNSENNPIYFMDNDGREPNRSQAANWSQIKTVLTNYFNNPANQSIHKLRYTETAGGGGGQVGPFGGENGPRYVYTEKYGWIDLGHFFQVASEIEGKVSSNGKAYRWFAKNSITAYYIAKSKLKTKTEEVENGQPEGSETQWSYEDAPSNLAGMDYWFYAFDNNKNIIETLQEFFEDAGIKKPEEAPNYNTMQDKPQKRRWFQQNKSMKPIKNPTPTSDNKKANPEKSEKPNSKRNSNRTKKKT
jgi:RHS repeat-associated protein